MAMKMKKYEELELRDDFMFSRIMSNPKFVKPLLETILGVKTVSYTHLDVYKRQIHNYSRDDD